MIPIAKTCFLLGLMVNIGGTNTEKPEPEQRVWSFNSPTIEYEGTPFLIDSERVIIRYQDGKRSLEVDLDNLDEADRNLARAMGPLTNLPPVNQNGLHARYIEESADTSGHTIDVPVVSSDYWQVAPKAPDVSPYNNTNNITAQDACDFTIWQDAEDRWNLVSCIRSVANNDSELNRLFYHWRSKGTELTEQFWEPQGIFLMPHPELGNHYNAGAVQAPHVIQHDGKYYMFYNSGDMFCLVSEDGIDWERQYDYKGDAGFFKMGRDVLLFRDEDGTGKWYAFYTGMEMLQRRADNLMGPWSEEEYSIGNNGNPESPFVLKRNGKYYLWEQMNVYISDSPELFDGPPITFTRIPSYPQYAHHLITHSYAPEIIIDDSGQYYLAGYNNGIFITKLDWVKRTPEDMRQWWDDIGRPEMIARYEEEYEIYSNRDHSSGWNKFAYDRAVRNLELFPTLDYKYIDP